MPDYLNGESLLADAVQRLGPLGQGRAILIVEGATDKAVFAGWCSDSVAQIVVAGGKNLALSAHRHMTDDDRCRIAVIVDCDGNAGVLCGSPNLVVTTFNDLEADLMMADRLRRVIYLLVGGGVQSDERLAAICDDVVARAIGAAKGIETVRHAARNAGIQLRGHPRDISFGRLRHRGDIDVEVEVALEELARVHALSPPRTTLTAEEIDRVQRALPGRVVPLDACSGKVLIAAAGGVLNMDFGVPKRVLGAFDDLVRTSVAVDAELREGLGVVRRLRRWEAAHGVRLLAA